MPLAPVPALRQLAGLYGVQTAYYNTLKQRQQASPESLLLALRLLGAPLATVSDAPSVLRARQLAWWQRGAEPVVVIWEGQPAQLTLRLPETRGTGRVAASLHLESGETHHWEAELAVLPPMRTAQVEGVSYVVKQLSVPHALPLGYHRCTLELSGQPYETMLISAPPQAYIPPDRPTWGVFAPLYALHAEESWGCGDFSALETLMSWVASLGGSVVATLPLLSAFLDTPCEPSPYMPASRLFWNELYIDVTRAPGLSACAAAQALLTSSTLQDEVATLRVASLVDYSRQMALKRRVLEALARWFFASPTHDKTALHQFMRTHPAVEDYACFRAVGERQQAPWSAWPTPQRDGVITAADYDEQVRNYHLYVQWLAHEQLTNVVAHGNDIGVRLYLDLPLGVHPESYDVWRERDVFVRGATVGAPPDAVFSKGQNWGSPPLHPEAIRAQGYRYSIAYLRHQLRQTGLLRIDHVMGLHRLFWIPQGLEAHQGVYVRYAAEELYAILSLESYRHQAGIVGENLGTVPTYVNTAMARHDLYRMYVMQYELAPTAQGAVHRVPQHAVASLNTHDMPPFAAYWQGLDIADRLDQRLLSQEEAEIEHNERQNLLQALQRFLQHRGLLTDTSSDPLAVLSACLAFLSASPARIVLMNLEDLWLETQPQNFPGTSAERPNWQAKMRYSLEVFQHRPQALAMLRSVNHLRTQGIDHHE